MSHEILAADTAVRRDGKRRLNLRLGATAVERSGRPGHERIDRQRDRVVDNGLACGRRRDLDRGRNVEAGRGVPLHIALFP